MEQHVLWPGERALSPGRHSGRGPRPFRAPAAAACLAAHRPRSQGDPAGLEDYLGTVLGRSESPGCAAAGRAGWGRP